MTGYQDSDDESSLSDFGSAESGVSTNVLLGYASTKPTEDAFSQLGGEPTWLDEKRRPSGKLVQCKTCNSYMALLLQLNGDLPDRFPGHERRLYVWACRRKACRRKAGSIRATRAVRVSQKNSTAPARHPAKTESSSAGDESTSEKKHQQQQPQSSAAYIGASLFGADASASPFSSSQNPFSGSNPSASSATSNASSGSTNNAGVSSLPETFAQKARISVAASPSAAATATYSTEPTAPWPDPSELPKAYPRYFLDAEYEFIPHEPSSANSKDASSHVRQFMDVDEPSAEGSSSGAGKEVLYESEHDKTFQHFADTLAHNPEQVLRYEFAGTPLLYSKTDPVGKALSGSQHHTEAASSGTNVNDMPRCDNCKSARCFELQLTPYAIVELEAEEEAATLLGEGMEWGTIILGVCSKDCSRSGGSSGQPAAAEEVDYLEEWCGVQWEEVVSRSPASGAAPEKGKGRKK